MANKDGGNMGRPAKYDPKYCNKIIKWSKEGTLPRQWSMKIGVARTTLNRWADNYPDFREAWGISKDIAEGMWLQKMIDSDTPVELTKATKILNMAFQMSEVHKVEAKQEIDATVQTTVEVSFGDRPE